MRCEYCGSVLEDSNTTVSCPNCGGAVKPPEKGQPKAAFVRELPDERKRQQLKESGCRYCPYCLSTNVSKKRMFPTVAHFVYFVGMCLITWYLWRIAKWFIIVPILILLFKWMSHDKLRCSDCNLEWFSFQAKIYEKYSKHLQSCLGPHHAVACPGINEQTIELYIDRVKIKKTSIRYNRITDVYHQLPQGNVLGFLSIRDESTKALPFPKTYEEAHKDKLTVLYEQSYAQYYNTVYGSLSEIAKENKKNS